MKRRLCQGMSLATSKKPCRLSPVLGRWGEGQNEVSLPFLDRHHSTPLHTPPNPTPLCSPAYPCLKNGELAPRGPWGLSGVAAEKGSEEVSKGLWGKEPGGAQQGDCPLRPAQPSLLLLPEL